MSRFLWLAAVLLLACSKTNRVDIDGSSPQGETCLSACQHAYQLGQAGAPSWCGLPVPAAGQKGSDMTACQNDCESQGTPPSVLDCAASSENCQELGSCGFLQKK